MPDLAKNVQISLDNHVLVNLVPTLGDTKVDWQGEDFNSEAVSEWIEPRNLGKSTLPTRDSERDERWTVSINVYVKTAEGGNTARRLWELIDLVLAAYEQTDISILDWSTSSTPVLATMRFHRASLTPVPPAGGRPVESSGLQQGNITLEGVIVT